MVHVCDSHAPAAPGPQAHQGEAFEQLAADSTCAHLPAGAALARGPGSLALPQTLPVSPHSSPGGSADGSASPENWPQTPRFAHHSGSISRRQRQVSDGRCPVLRIPLALSFLGQDFGTVPPVSTLVMSLDEACTPTPGSHRRAVLGIGKVLPIFREAVKGIEVQPLVQGHELPGDCLEASALV